MAEAPKKACWDKVNLMIFLEYQQSDFTLHQCFMSCGVLDQALGALSQLQFIIEPKSTYIQVQLKVFEDAHTRTLRMFLNAPFYNSPQLHQF